MRLKNNKLLGAFITVLKKHSKPITIKRCEIKHTCVLLANNNELKINNKGIKIYD